MGCETRTKSIGNEEYSVTQWPAEKALLMKFRMAKVLGAAVATLGAGEDALTSKDGIAALAARGISEIFVHSSPEEVVALLKDTVIGVARDGKKITAVEFDIFFSGADLGKVYKVFLFVLEVNFSGLISGQQLDGLLAKLSPEPSTSPDGQE